MAKRQLDEPNMSDRSLLCTVEDLIHLAMGPTEKNTVNFKLVQTILYILARQMRLLKQSVELRIFGEEEGEGEGSPISMRSYSTRDDADETKQKKERASKSVPKDTDSVKDAKTKTPRSVSVDKGKAGKGKGKKGEGSDSDSPRVRKESDDEREKGGKSKRKSRKDEDRSKSSDRKSKGKTPSDTSLTITEVQRKGQPKEKTLVGGAKAADHDRDGIEVVTRSQFNDLKSTVRNLQKYTEPLPAPALPDNKKLRGQLAKGSATLLDTMQAMQVTARVRAAEEAITRMGDLLTQLAAAGALPDEFADQLEGVRFIAPDADAMTIASLPPTKSQKGAAGGTTRKSVAIDPMTAAEEENEGRSAAAAASRASMASRQASAMSRASLGSTTGFPGVTVPEMNDCLRVVKDELLKSIQALTVKANSNAEHASVNAKAVSAKLDIAINLDSRISTLHSLVSDYAEQLSGFDVGLTTQMQSFRDQINQMRTELQTGLKQLEEVNNNAETADLSDPAVRSFGRLLGHCWPDGHRRSLHHHNHHVSLRTPTAGISLQTKLRERFDGLVLEMDHTLHMHRSLTSQQRQIAEDLRGLLEGVEMLREQKSDRDEVMDALKDKADKSRLAGLLTVSEFTRTRIELEDRLELCHDKFHRQDGVWMKALKDLGVVTESKAEISQLLVARDTAEHALQQLKEMQDKLALKLGEPKAALLTRLLAKDAACGACLVPALMHPWDKSYGAPPALPAMRPRPLDAAPEPCVAEWHLPEPPDDREHICQRWVGGSHTLMVTGAVSRSRAPDSQPDAVPTKRYTAYGTDGHLYMLDEQLQPCAECNQYLEKDSENVGPPAALPPPEVQPQEIPLIEVGAGDRGQSVQQSSAVDVNKRMSSFVGDARKDSKKVSVVAPLEGTQE